MARHLACTAYTHLTLAAVISTPQLPSRLMHSLGSRRGSARQTAAGWCVPMKHAWLAKRAGRSGCRVRAAGPRDGPAAHATRLHRRRKAGRQAVRGAAWSDADQMRASLCSASAAISARKALCCSLQAGMPWMCRGGRSAPVGGTTPLDGTSRVGCGGSRQAGKQPSRAEQRAAVCRHMPVGQGNRRQPRAGRAFFPGRSTSSTCCRPLACAAVCR